ncbi:hypothetical protein [Paraclostridium dentum]|uniref:hypothetical protein n=1 Tax=Paraclostridium dentum TaxID=2662455 RepID=UPI003F35AB0B
MTNVEVQNSHYRVNGGTNVSFNINNPGGGNPFAYEININDLNQNSSYGIHIASSDTLRNAIEALGHSVN